MAKKDNLGVCLATVICQLRGIKRKKLLKWHQTLFFGDAGCAKQVRLLTTVRNGLDTCWTDMLEGWRFLHSPSSFLRYLQFPLSSKKNRDWSLKMFRYHISSLLYTASRCYPQCRGKQRKQKDFSYTVPPIFSHKHGGTQQNFKGFLIRQLERAQKIRTAWTLLG